MHFIGNFDRWVRGEGVLRFVLTFLRRLSGLFVMVCVFLLRCYRVLLGPLLGGSCRFIPSCSHYAEQALQKHGSLHGLRLTLGRLSRCRPFHVGGYDPVPERASHLDQLTNHETWPRSR